MENISETAVCDESGTYVPAWQRKENPIKVLAGGAICAELYENNDGIGVSLMGPLGIEFAKEEAAIVFAESSEDLYLRTDFSTVVKISRTEGNGEIFERLSKTKVALCIFRDGMFGKNESSIPVFHDEVEARYFVRRDEPDGTVEDLSDSDETDDFVESDTDDTDDFLIRETPSVMQAPAAPVGHDDEIEAAVDAEIAARNGVLAVRHKNDVKDRFSYDVAIVGQRGLVIMYFGLEGEWLADEEQFSGNAPLWFSDADNTISPVYFAGKWVEMSQETVHGLPVAAIVAVSAESTFMNEDAMQGVWENTCHVGVARTARAENSELPSLKEYLDSLPAPKGPQKDLTPETIKMINKNFLRNYWK